MAYTTSGQLPIGSDYQLGEYTVSLSAQLVPSYNSIYAYSEISDSSGKIDGKGVNIPFGFTAKNWHIEATENDISVYLNVETYDPYDDAADHYSDDSGLNALKISYTYRTNEYTEKEGVRHYFYVYPKTLYYYKKPKNAETLGSVDQVTLLLTIYGSTLYARLVSGSFGYWLPTLPFSIKDGEYYRTGTSNYIPKLDEFTPSPLFGPNDVNVSIPVSGVKPGSQELHPVTGKRAIVEYLVARFPINYGESDPYKTLHVNINGALSGRHNDPLNDTSYSYVPADKATVKSRGCGGDGGHGGGGGAGASTIIVNHFATGKANYKDINANAKRHGYGSGGGKGGTGGDGCIIVYY